MPYRDTAALRVLLSAMVTLPAWLHHMLCPAVDVLVTRVATVATSLTHWLLCCCWLTQAACESGAALDTLVDDNKALAAVKAATETELQQEQHKHADVSRLAGRCKCASRSVW